VEQEIEADGVRSVPTSLETAECTRNTASLIAKFINEQDSIDIDSQNGGSSIDNCEMTEKVVSSLINGEVLNDFIAVQAGTYLNYLGSCRFDYCRE